MDPASFSERLAFPGRYAYERRPSRRARRKVTKGETMSAPDVDIEKQKHRHRTMARGLWIGGAVAVLVAAGLAVAMGVFDTDPTEVIPSADAGAE
jgi:hypothetical protein